MPDLIIKPTATSGNKLILKDQGGGAVLTTGDSGATIANATLTTPTIASMANCTFPAGMVIQTVQNTYNSANSVSITAGGSFIRHTISGGSMPFTGQITNVKENSWVLIQMYFTAQSHNTSDRVDLGTGSGLFRESTAIFTPREYNSYWYRSDGSGISESKQVLHQHTISFIDKSPATGTNNYYAGGLAYTSANITIMADANYAPFVCILQEIAQ